MKVVFSILVTLGTASLVLVARNARQYSLRTLTAVLGVTMMVGATVAPAASATTAQAKLTITANKGATNQAGTVITLATSGGSGSGAVSLNATGTGCSFNAAASTLTANAAATCVVTASKAASGAYSAATATATYKFTVSNQAKLAITNKVLTAAAGTGVIVTFSGGSGSGAVSYSAVGSVCSINSLSGALLASAAGTCLVTVTKAASTGWNAASSSAVKFTFTPPPLTISNASLDGSTGIAITVTTSGGIGSGVVTFAVTGAGCTIDANTGALNAASPTTCVVTATKAKSSTGAIQVSAPVRFQFSPASDGPTFSKPDVATIVSVNGIQGAAIDDTESADGNFITQFYSASDRLFQGYVAVGSTVTVKWHVAGVDGSALANMPVTLVDNLAYSAANGTSWSQSGLNTNPCTGAAPNFSCSGQPGGTLAGKTDANGDVTFTLNNTNTATGSNPADMTTAGGAESNEGTYPWTRMFLQIGTDVITANPNTTVNEASDLLDLIVVPTATTVTNWTAPVKVVIAPSPAVATLTAVTGLVTGTTAIDDTVNGDNWFINAYYAAADKLYESYVPAGATVTMTWHVANASGPMKSLGLNLIDNLSYGCTTGVTWSTASLNQNPGCGGGVGGSLSGKTDASGNVTFTLTNTNASSGVCPTNMTTQPTAGVSPANANEKTPKNAGLYNWTRFAIQVPGDVITGDPLIINQGTDLFDTIVVPANCTAGSTPGTWTAPAGTGTGTGTGTGGSTGDNPTNAAPDKASLVTTSWSSTGLNGSGPVDDTANGDNWFINKYYAASDKWLYTYAAPGAALHLTWHVAGKDGSALANTLVTLETQFAPGPSGATFSGTNMDAKGNISGTTDANGNVTFDFTNTNATAIGAPAKWSATSATSAEAIEGGGSKDYAWTRMALLIGTPLPTTKNASSSDIITAGGTAPMNTTVTQATDLVDVIIMGSGSAPAGGTGGQNGPTNANPDKAALVTTSWSTSGLAGSGPVDDTANGLGWFITQFYASSDKWYYGYAHPGATVKLTWHVVDYNGAAMAGKTVTLETQFAPGTKDATFSAASMDASGNITGTTDASGNVTFTLTNTNASASSAPAGFALTSTAAGENVEKTYAWTRMALLIGTPLPTSNGDASATDIISAPNASTTTPNPTVTQATDLVDLIVVAGV